MIVSMQEELKGVKLESQSLKEYMREQTAAAENSNCEELVTQQDLENQVIIVQYDLTLGMGSSNVTLRKFQKF